MNHWICTSGWNHHQLHEPIQILVKTLSSSYKHDDSLWMIFKEYGYPWLSYPQILQLGSSPFILNYHLSSSGILGLSLSHCPAENRRNHQSTATPSPHMMTHGSLYSALNCLTLSRSVPPWWARPGPPWGLQKMVWGKWIGDSSWRNFRLDASKAGPGNPGVKCCSRRQPMWKNIRNNVRIRLRRLFSATCWHSLHSRTQCWSQGRGRGQAQRCRYESYYEIISDALR